MTQESQPQPRKAPKITRRTFLGGLAAGALALAGCKPGEPTTTSPTTKPNITETTIPGTTTELPTTTLEARPTDIIEQKDGYGIMRNGGLHYEVESAPWFGGFDIHLKYGGATFGFQKETYDGRDPKEFLLNTLLWTFGNQHPEFVKTDGQVDIEAYKTYLESNDWVDNNVHLPDNVAAGPTGYPSPVVKSATYSLDFKKPLVFGNDDLEAIDGFALERPNFYIVNAGDGAQSVLGITNDGQLYFSNYFSTPDGKITPPVIGPGYVFLPSMTFGSVLAVTSRITYPEETPKLQWQIPDAIYKEPALSNPTGVAPKYPIIDSSNFGRIDIPNDTIDEVLFEIV